MPALYRTYRPQQFKDVIGQEHIVTTLQNAILTQRVVHAYLFCGPRGTGKTSLARIFAKTLNCENRSSQSSEPCLTCNTCQAIVQNSAIDLIEIDAASNRGIDEIRNLKESVRFAPSRKGAYKVYIIDEVHMLTKDACNALLKTLEEPPAHVIFILATTDPHKMLPTILSRVQRFDFKRISSPLLKTKLSYIAKQEGVTIPDSVIDMIVLNARGGARDAESILGKLISYSGPEVTLEIAESVLGKSFQLQPYTLIDYIISDDLVASLTFINSMVQEGYAIDQFSNLLIQALRSVLLFKVNPNSIDKDNFSETEYTFIQEFSQKLSFKDLTTLLNLFSEASLKISSSIIPQLPIEVALVQYIELIDDSSNQNQIAKEPIVAPVKAPEVPSLSTEPDKRISPIAALVSEIRNDVKQSTGPLTVFTLAKDKETIAKELMKKNHSIGMLFKLCNPHKIEQNTILFTVSSQLYKSRLEKFSSIIETTLAKMYQLEQLVIQFVLEGDVAQQVQTAPDEIAPKQPISSSPTAPEADLQDVFAEFM